MSYPSGSAARDRWILERRPPRNVLDPRRPYAFLAEQEPGPEGALVDVATLFLTNRECPFRCVMCDLWRNTLAETVPRGAIAEQVRFALEQLTPDLGPSSWIKLYNAGSFFDPRAIPPEEYAEVARLSAPFRRVIVECHPAFVGERCLDFQRHLAAASYDGPPVLEVAMGLETAHPGVLERLNKRMTLASFREAANFLKANAIDLRVFILVRPPWLSEAEGLEWACRSLDFAFDCGASVCSLIPTRDGNGAVEALARSGEYAPPSLETLEAALAYGLRCGRGRVFVDTWDLERFAACPECSAARIRRLAAMNAEQRAEEGVACGVCGAAGSRGE